MVALTRSNNSVMSFANGSQCTYSKCVACRWLSTRYLVAVRYVKQQTSKAVSKYLQGLTLTRVTFRQLGCGSSHDMCHVHPSVGLAIESGDSSLDFSGLC